MFQWIRLAFNSRTPESSGRFMALLCVVIAEACWLSGVFLPSLATHASNGMNAFLLAAAGFYGVTKFNETIAKNKQDDKLGG